MKTTKQKAAILILICGLNVVLLFVLLLNLESTSANPAPTFMDTTHLPDDLGGGEGHFGHDHLPEFQRAAIEEMLQENVNTLGLVDTLDVAGGTAVSLTFPLTGATHFNDFGFHAISNFVDQNPSGGILDYNCGDITYNGHRGTDYFLWPFDWNKMDNGDVEVIAAAAGTIIGKQDGNQDRSCTWVNAPPWNAVYIRHADNSVAWYGHLKQGSVLTKSIGDTVAQGEYLGLVGSSGMSSGPHLHLELWQDNSYTQLHDPYAGSCNALNVNSWWQAQRPYYDSAINKVMTGESDVDFQACGIHDVTYEKTNFEPGERIYFTTFYRDQLDSQQSEYTIYRPDGSVFQQWTHNSNAPHYSASYWYWSYTIPTNEQEGTWRFSVNFESKTYDHTFSVQYPAFITVTNPAGGSEWLPAETHTITWESTYTNNVKIDLYKGLTFSSTLTSTTEDDGQFAWTIPLSPTLAPDYQIRITDVASPTLLGTSSFFAIGEMDKVYLPAVLRQ